MSALGAVKVTVCAVAPVVVACTAPVTVTRPLMLRLPVSGGLSVLLVVTIEPELMVSCPAVAAALLTHSVTSAPAALTVLSVVRFKAPLFWLTMMLPALVATLNPSASRSCKFRFLAVADIWLTVSFLPAPVTCASRVLTLVATVTSAPASAFEAPPLKTLSATFPAPDLNRNLSAVTSATAVLALPNCATTPAALVTTLMPPCRFKLPVPTSIAAFFTASVPPVAMKP